MAIIQLSQQQLPFSFSALQKKLKYILCTMRQCCIPLIFHQEDDSLHSLPSSAWKNVRLLRKKNPQMSEQAIKPIPITKAQKKGQ